MFNCMSMNIKTICVLLFVFMLCHRRSFAFPVHKVNKFPVHNEEVNKENGSGEEGKEVRNGTSFIPENDYCTNFAKPESEKDGNLFVQAVKNAVKDKMGSKKMKLTPAWKQFLGRVRKINSNEDQESCDPSMLSSVKVKQDGEFQFSCSSAEKLCSCISAVGSGSVEEQIFVVKSRKFEVDFKMYKGEGKRNGLNYEISVNGQALHFSDINGGNAKNALGNIRRRRRLLQGGTSGSAS
jgi:hypothetical protein